MQLFIKKIYQWLPALLLGTTLACGSKEAHTTGDDPGETNRENPTVENRDQTGYGFTREHEDGSAGAEVGPSPGVDSTTTDSTQIKVQMGR